MNHYNYRKSDIRYLLPIQKGQTVAVFGQVPEIVEMITSSGVKCVSISSHPQTIEYNFDVNHVIWPDNDQKKKQRILLNSESVNHIIILDNMFYNPEWTYQEILRIIKPGGTLYFGLKNPKYILSPFLNFGRRAKLNSTRSKFARVFFRNLITKDDFELIDRYGIYKDFENPKFYISLDNLGPTHYFFKNTLQSYSIKSKIYPVLFSLYFQEKKFEKLFKYLGIVAQRI